MKQTLSEIPKAKQYQIFEIEYNILPILESVGINIGKEDIKNEILKDLEQTVVTYETESEIRGIFRYSIEDEHIFVKSLFLNPAINGFNSFSGLGKEIYLALKDEKSGFVRSVVQVSNQKSLKLHRRFGFVAINENAKMIKFQIKRVDLISKLENYLKITK